MTCSYLTRELYDSKVAGIGTGHWKSAAGRWGYHEAAVNIARELAPAAPSQVLELGTMGVSCVIGSHTMDYAEKWNVRGFRPTYAHDARITPWPVADKAYELFIALRVFHHLTPAQEACFHEARRIARNIVIVTPTEYDVPELKATSRGLGPQEFTAWNGGTPPSRIVPFQSWIGNLYFWDRAALGG